MPDMTYCLNCGTPLATFGVGAFRTCERCALAHRRKAADAPALKAGTDIAALRASMAALGLSTTELDSALLDSAEARAKSVADANAHKRAIMLATRQNAALARVSDAAMRAAREALAQEYAAEPEVWREGWYVAAADTVQVGSLNAPDAVRDPACNLGTLTLTATRTRR